MEKILSQEEIDALLQGMEEGKVDTQPEQLDQSGVVPFDFTNQDRIIRGRMPRLEMINDHFSRLFRNTLSSALRKMIDVSSRGVQMMKFGEFIKTLPVPSSLHIFKMEPLRGHSLLVLESKLVFTLLDLFFGGTGKTPYRIEGREFTAIESRLIHKVVTMIFTDLEKAWRTVHLLTFHYIRSEVNPQFATIVPPTDLVMTIPFEVELDEFTGVTTLCIPYSNIEPIRTKLYSGYQRDQLEVDQNWIERFLEHLKGAEVEIKVELGRRRITVQNLLQLKVGDTFILEKEVTEPLVAQVQGVNKFFVKAGTYGGNRAVQIEGRILSS